MAGMKSFIRSTSGRRGILSMTRAILGPSSYSSHGRLKGSHVSARALASKSTLADVISWSGCQDGQTSADTFAGGVAVGAMSHAFVSALTTKPHQSYQELLRSIRLILHPRYSQKPQLGSSHHIVSSLFLGLESKQSVTDGHA
ncbi:hypothetical protein D9613_001326 [Agrocybe pediades]|uniref:Peptidase C14 caspase domain-containing protein n=1 Tax=Agrocybe pediades TaxID=84607 RepID=A0A8H4R8R3_9AGAR|nr:hypothetical protein D9613_001326 [Agrocybe pediades]